MKWIHWELTLHDSQQSTSVNGSEECSLKIEENLKKFRTLLEFLNFFFLFFKWTSVSLLIAGSPRLILRPNWNVQTSTWMDSRQWKQILTLTTPSYTHLTLNESEIWDSWIEISSSLPPHFCWSQSTLRMILIISLSFFYFLMNFCASHSGINF